MLGKQYMLANGHSMFRETSKIQILREISMKGRWWLRIDTKGWNESSKNRARKLGVTSTADRSLSHSELFGIHQIWSSPLVDYCEKQHPDRQSGNTTSTTMLGQDLVSSLFWTHQTAISPTTCKQPHRTSVKLQLKSQHSNNGHSQ